MTWSLDYGDNDDLASLEGVWGASATDVYAVGYDNNARKGAIRHFDGTNWTSAAGAFPSFTGIWGSSASDIFAVGDGAIWRYDGSAWSPMSGTFPKLAAVWGTSSSDVFAVGVDSTSGAALVLNYDGASWRATSLAHAANLTGVWGSSPTDVYAVGSHTDSGASLLVHYDGKAWTYVSNPAPGPLNGVWGESASSVFAVGDNGVTVHYNGVNWSTWSCGDTGDMGAIWAASPSDAFAAGNGGVFRYDGGSWANVVPRSAWGAMCAVWGNSASDVYASGPNVTMHYDGVSWNTLLTQGSCRAWGVSPSNFYLAHTNSILHYKGSSLTTEWSGGAYSWLGGVWGSSASDIFALGSDGPTGEDEGFALRSSGGGWQRTNLYGIEGMNYVWGTSSSNVLGVGTNYDRGVLFSFDGRQWSSMAWGGGNVTNAASVLGLWATSPSDVYVAGDEDEFYSGMVYHFNGAAFKSVWIPTRAAAAAVTGIANSDLFVVSVGGTILHRDGPLDDDDDDDDASPADDDDDTSPSDDDDDNDEDDDDDDDTTPFFDVTFDDDALGDLPNPPWRVIHSQYSSAQVVAWGGDHNNVLELIGESALSEMVYARYDFPAPIDQLMELTWEFYPWPPVPKGKGSFNAFFVYVCADSSCPVKLYVDPASGAMEYWNQSHGAYEFCNAFPGYVWATLPPTVVFDPANLRIRIDCDSGWINLPIAARQHPLTFMKIYSGGAYGAGDACIVDIDNILAVPYTGR